MSLQLLTATLNTVIFDNNNNNNNNTSVSPLCHAVALPLPFPFLYFASPYLTLIETSVLVYDVVEKNFVEVKSLEKN